MAKNTVVVKTYNNVRDEKVASGAITPGMLVERTSDDKVKAHATAGGPANRLFAVEDAPSGNGLSDTYADANTVLLWHPGPGDQVYAIADDTTGVAIAIGDFVESAGDGRLRELSPVQSSAGVSEFAQNVVGVALEAASNGERFLIEII